MGSIMADVLPHSGDPERQLQVSASAVPQLLCLGKLKKKCSSLASNRVCYSCCTCSTYSCNSSNSSNSSSNGGRFCSKHEPRLNDSTAKLQRHPTPAHNLLRCCSSWRTSGNIHQILD
mmetsp:Transcript_56206/g.111709  ORF Transcript_56206/g.111709 Transcript_56206/m.111709 type:complete len:118 (+) Transcript_56206:307-660(+)